MKPSTSLQIVVGLIILITLLLSIFFPWKTPSAEEINGKHSLLTPTLQVDPTEVVTSLISFVGGYIDLSAESGK